MATIIFRGTPTQTSYGTIILSVPLTDNASFSLNHSLVISSTNTLQGTFSLSTSLVINVSHQLAGSFSSSMSLVLESTSSLISGSSFVVAHDLVINANAALYFTNPVITSVSAICLNLTTGGHSTYTNYVFDKFVTNENAYYGENNGTAFELTGTTDNGTVIPWSITYPVMDFDTPVQKNVQDAYLYMRNNEDVELVTYIDDEKERGGYIITSDERLGLHRRRKLLPKGIKGTAWQLKLQSEKSIIELKQIELSAEKTQRVQ